MPKGFYVTLETPEGTQRWRVAPKKMSNYGLTDWQRKTIWYRPNQTMRELVDTLIHEATHVATGIGSEQTIEQGIERVAGCATSLLFAAKLITEET